MKSVQCPRQKARGTLELANHSTTTAPYPYSPHLQPTLDRTGFVRGITTDSGVSFACTSLHNHNLHDIYCERFLVTGHLCLPRTTSLLCLQSYYTPFFPSILYSSPHRVPSAMLPFSRVTYPVSYQSLEGEEQLRHLNEIAFCALFQEQLDPNHSCGSARGTEFNCCRFSSFLWQGVGGFHRAVVIRLQ